MDFVRGGLQSTTCTQVLLVLVIVLLVGNDFCDFIENSTGKSFKVVFGLIVIAVIAYVIRNASVQNRHLNESIK